MEPAISDRGVVWTDYREGPKDPDIQMYDFKMLADVSITNGSFNHTNPSIAGDNIVWTDNRNGHYNVYLYNSTTNKERNITSDGFDHSSPDISGNNVIWTDKSKGNLDIFLYDLLTGKTRQITSGTIDHYYGMIDGNNIIWTENDIDLSIHRLVLYNITTGTKAAIIETPIGGNILAHAATTRLYLRKSKEDKRIERHEDSPNMPEGECVKKITPAGIKD